MFLISDLCDITEGYLKPDQVKEIYRAYEYGAEAHEGQQRASGEPYIHHPLEVARILASMRMDYPTIVAAILHDVIEDTHTIKTNIETEFGTEIAELVDGVSKLNNVSFESRVEAQAENFRKMLMAMARDIRVILVKLADRLHNMRTIGALDMERRRRIARETLEIYAPIAERLGLNSIRLELEDLGFKALHPDRFRVLAAEVKKARGHRKQVIRRIETAIKRRLRQEGLSGQVAGREKHLYSLYRKMEQKGLSFADVMDVYAFRIIVDNVDTCYRLLGVIHGLYKPLPGRFKDYVALPKANGYQSLHTVLFGPYGVPIEVQIRTEDMHKVAETGIAAHGLYKTGASAKGTNAAQKRARQWLTELLDMQKQAGDSIEFLENVKVDLFPKEVYVFTPAGDIMELPRGATPVDLAYTVHTDVGNRCIAAKIDGRYVPLSAVLATGQNVEIVTAPWGRPNAHWLNFVVTGKARANIHNFLKGLRTEEAQALGRRLLNQALAAESLSIDEVQSELLEILLEELELGSIQELLEDIGLGKRIAPLVARRLLPESHPESAAEQAGASRQIAGGNPVYIHGTEGMVVNFGRCCRPIPGDAIVGFVSSGRGIVIHTTWCKNIAEYSDQPEKWVEVDWESDIKGEFPVDIRIDTNDQKGVLATIAASISELEANIENVTMENRDGMHTLLNFTINVENRAHLAHIIRHIRGLPRVTRITRALR